MLDPTEEAKYTIGYSLIAFLSVNLVVDLINALIDVINSIK